MRSQETDVCVVGGGPAGLSAAIALRLEGFSVQLFECNRPPIDKACGEGLMPDSLAALGELGVTIPTGAGYPLKGIRFTDSSSSVSADFPHGLGLGMRRTVLHQCLEKRAREVGVALHWGAKGARLSPTGLMIDGKAVPTRFVVAGDGLNSQVRRQAGLDSSGGELHRYGFRRHFSITPWSHQVELHWGNRKQLYITPISEKEIGVALLSWDPKLRLEQALREFVEIRERLSAAPPSSRETGSVTVSRTLERVCGEGVALVGDASGSVDAITGEGMCIAFRQALALAKAFKAEDLQRYEKAHRALLRRPLFMARLMLTMGKHKRLRGRLLSTLAAYPDVFARFLAIHVGHSSFVDLCDRRLLNAALTFARA